MLAHEGKNPFKLDSKPATKPLKEFTSLETRFRMLEKSHPERAKELALLAQGDVKERWALYEQYAHDGGAAAPEKGEEKE
jgi:pyruvate-ferredoxin/flavodoxin oxidoreductase